MQRNKGSSLLEIVLYIALYSIIFSGFVRAIFMFETTIAMSAERHDELIVSSLFKQLLTHHIHHSTSNSLTTNATSTSILFQTPSGGYRFDEVPLRRLLVSYPSLHLSSILFKKSTDTIDLHFLFYPSYIVFSYTLNTHTYEMRIQIP